MCMDIFFCGGKNTLTDIVGKKNSENYPKNNYFFNDRIDFLEYKFMQMVVPENECTY